MAVRTIALACVGLTVAILPGCLQSAKETNLRQPPMETKLEVPKQPSADAKLEITDLAVGQGAVAETGKTVTVHYRGTLKDGTEFDSSRKGAPFTFRLGAGKVIRGWDEGVKGMKVGGKRKLVIPPSMGYGERGAGRTIPPNATLTFEVELLAVDAE